jgi:predicted molibdopterin-dependent oxidoreductase YjgC
VGPIRLLIVSGDEALADPNVRALAQQAEQVIAIAMFTRGVRGIADLVLPATSYLERDGTYVNLEGRLQRLRRAVIPPTPDELAWISKLAERFGLRVSPYPSQVFDELSELAYDGIAYGDIGERAPLRPRTAPTEPATTPEPERPPRGLRLVTYRPLFSGPAVERVPELQFQRPAPELELSREDARRLGVSTGDEVSVRSNGTSIRLRARVSRATRRGVVRAAVEHVGGLEGPVEVTP